MFQGGPYSSIEWLGPVPPISWAVTRLQGRFHQPYDTGQWPLILAAYHRLPKCAFKRAVAFVLPIETYFSAGDRR
jgi:hypothetical protein